MPLKSARRPRCCGLRRAVSSRFLLASISPTLPGRVGSAWFRLIAIMRASLSRLGSGDIECSMLRGLALSSCMRSRVGGRSTRATTPPLACFVLAFWCYSSGFGLPEWKSRRFSSPASRSRGFGAASNGNVCGVSAIVTYTHCPSAREFTFALSLM